MAEIQPDEQSLEEMLKNTLRWAADYKKQITQLKTDLAKFGGHTDECASRPPSEEVWVKGCEPKCDCGWAEIEKGL